MSILDNRSILTEQQMFFGDGHFIQEFVNPKYPWALKSVDQQEAQKWPFDEFNLKLDAAQLASSNQAIRHIFTSNLQSQVVADSVQGRGPSWLIRHVTDPNLEYAFNVWASFECFTEDHELLTPEGWVPIKSITKEHKIAQYNQKSEEISFVNPTALIKKEYDGNMYHINSDNGYVNQFITENHRIPLIDKTNSSVTVRETLAKDFRSTNSYALPTGGYVRHGRSMSALEKIFVAVQADGSLATDKYTGERKGTIHYSFRLKKKRKIQRLISLAKEANLDYTIYSVKEEGFELISIHVPVQDYRKDVKTFDWIDYESVSCEWIEDFIQELTYWDGCRSGGSLRYTTSNNKVLDKVNTLAHLGGYRAHTYVVPPTDRVFPAWVSRKCKEGYQITFSKTTSANCSSIKKDVYQFKGTVYCVSVPDSFIMVRRKGTISISGQCLHSRTYTRIITSMYPNPKLVIDMADQKPEIMQRFKACVERYDIFDANPTRENLVLLIAAINILEGLSFYISFICNFGFANMGLFESVAKFLRQISFDERLHVALTQNIMNTWRKGLDGPVWREIWNDNKATIRNMWLDAAETEISMWNPYLFKYGTPIVGVTQQNTADSVEFYANKRMKNLELKPMSNLTKDPLPWMQTKYLSNRSYQAAPQEVSVSEYVKNPIEKIQNLDNLHLLF